MPRPQSDDSNPFGDPDFSAPTTAPSSNGQNVILPSPRSASNSSVPPPAATIPIDNFNNTFGFYRDSMSPGPSAYGTMHPAPVLSSSPAYVDQAKANTEDLRRRQEDLEAKANELERREEELRNSPYNVRKNNWPPLPGKCCVGPCFYQDFEVDIPLAYQSVVKAMYYLWMSYSMLLVVNLVASTAYIGVAGIGKGTTFGLSILWVVLFAPCSFLLWYRPVYKAFRSDSSMNFFIFFIIFTAQIGVTIVQCLGIDACGTSGIINGLSMITTTEGGTSSSKYIGVGIFMLIVGLLFAVLALINAIFMLRVLRIYRTTGASFAKAQSEFASSAMKNKTVQNAAAGAATSAMRNEHVQNAVINTAQRNLYGGTEHY